MGKDRTLLLMNHGDRTGVTFDEHYSTGLRYVPLVGIQLDDFAGNLGPVERVCGLMILRQTLIMHRLHLRTKSSRHQPLMF